MSEVKIELIVPKDVPDDLKMMSLWYQAYREYSDSLTASEATAAADWFKSFIDNEISKST